MRASLTLPLVLFLLAGCKSPSSEATAAKAEAPFTSVRFNFSYTPPAGLHQVDLSELQIKIDHPNPNEIPILAARDPDRPYGVVAIGEKMNVPTAHNPTGFRNGDDFLRLIAPVNAQEQGFRELNQIHVTNAAGLVISELDYTIAGEYDAGLTFPVHTTSGDWLVVFKCNAASAAELALMTASVRAARAA